MANLLKSRFFNIKAYQLSKMVAVSGGLIFLGYQLLTYGWSQVRGANAGFFDILWPGRYKVVAPDAASVGTYTPGVGLNNTAQGGTKQIVLETGATVNAPLFINEGDVVRINTELGTYVERVDKK